jgi:glutamate synthase (NADPH) large chain
MSGGIAYVLDEDGAFEQRCNLAMVDLEPIAAEEDRMSRFSHQAGDLHGHGLVDVQRDMTRYDAVRLRQLVENHRHYTGSERARLILENWDADLPKFVKVMPVEYRKALEAMTHHQAADTTGFDILEIGLRNGR